MLLRGTRRDLIVRPQDYQGVQWDSPLAAGLRHLWPLDGQSHLNNLVTNQPLTVNAGSGFRYGEAHPILGRSLFNPSGAVGSMLISGLSDLAAPWTIHWWWHRIATATSVSVLTSRAGTTTGVRPEQYPTTFALGFSTGSDLFVSGATVPTDRAVPITYTQASGAGINASIYATLNAGKMLRGTIASSGSVLTLSRLGNYADAVSLAMFGWWGHLHVWDRVLSESEVALLHEPPTQWDTLWVPVPRAYLFLGGGGGTGTASLTLEAVTLSATGTLAIAGTAAPTLGAVTSVATGTVALAGTASPTLDSVTLAGTSGVAIAGAVAATLGDITLAATGAVALAGQVSATLGAVTLSAASTLLVQGVLAVTLDPITGALEGDLADSPGTGSLNGQLDPVTLTAAGVVALTGSASATFEAVTLTATGAVALAGQTAATLGAVTSTATGALAIAGVVTATLGEVTLAATGSSGVGAILDATLAPVTLAGTGAVALRGEVAATLAPVVLTAFGAQAQITMLAIVSEQLLVAHLRTEALRRAGVATESLHG